MQNKERLNYKVSFKYLSICFSLTLIIIIIANLILYQIDKFYEDKVIHFFLRGQLQNIESLIVKDINNIIIGKEIDNLLVIKNIVGLKSYKQSTKIGLVIEIPKHDGTKIIADVSNIAELIETIAKDNFNYSIKLSDQLICGDN